MMITVLLNGKEFQIPHGLSLESFINKEVLLKSDMPVACAVNENFVAKSMRASYILNDKDEITTFSPITGG